MKVIKVGLNAQTRIAQACDRCRSKKIRCDGVRPCCSQCSSVGFECKTSDKLSRRAFPRGYTESLEERVRSLECEVRELKDLLDEKDEKIDLLSRLHSQSAPTFQPSPKPSPSSVPVRQTEKEDMFRMQQSPYLEGHGATSYFAGTSSSKMFFGTGVRCLFLIPTTDLFSQTLSNKRCRKADIQPQTSTPKNYSQAIFTYNREMLWQNPSCGKPHLDSSRIR